MYVRHTTFRQGMQNITHPELFQVLQMAHVLNLFDLVRRHVERRQLQVLLQSLDLFQAVMRKIEFFEVVQLFEVLQLCDSIGLDG